ncbi:MAG: SDR family oxidoreductase [Planctomycetes bacterium]|nr:SDR family oxidoreductase [Planctomycetota bacterium]
MDLSGKKAIVTGGSKGYGLGIAAALKQAGADVWITGREQSALDAAAKETGARPIRADVASTDDWDRVFAEVTSATAGRLDLLVNNAGAGIAIAPVHQQSDADIDTAIRVNLIGAILGCRRAAAVMSQQGSGMIVNISSVCALHAWPGWSVYSAAKAGLAKFAHGLYTELRPFGVRVTTVTPSWGATEFNQAAHLGTRDAQTTGHCMQPAEMGRLIVDLCTMPDHLVVPEIVVQPIVQEIVPM